MYLLHVRPISDNFDLKIQLFNESLAYFVMMILVVFNQKTSEDYTGEELKLEADNDLDDELFISPAEKYVFGWVCVISIVNYLCIHMGLFLHAVIGDLINKCKNCGKTWTCCDD